MPEDVMEKPVSVEDVLQDVAKVKARITDAVDDGVRSAMRAMKQGRYAAEDALLAFEPGSLIQQAQIVSELDVKGLRSVHGMQVKRIDGGEATRCLHLNSRTERSAPGEVGARRNPVPIPEGRRQERCIVIAPSLGAGHRETPRNLLRRGAQHGAP